MKNIIKKWLDIKTKDIRSTSNKDKTLQRIIQDLHIADDRIDSYRGRINALQSQIDKRANELQSQFDQKLSKLENRLKDNNDDQIDLLENLTKFLLDKEGLRLYTLKEVKPFYSDYRYFHTYFTSPSKTSEDETMCEEIDIDELKTLGDYTTISIGKKKYFIAKRKTKK